MRNTYLSDIIDDKIVMVNSLITDIFELSIFSTTSNGIERKSYDKFQRDVFYLDCARFQIELFLIKLGISVEKFYDYKYRPTSPNDDEYRCFSYSFKAVITLWKNLIENNIVISEAHKDFINESLINFINNIEKCKKVIIDEASRSKAGSYIYNNTIAS